MNLHFSFSLPLLCSINLFLFFLSYLISWTLDLAAFFFLPWVPSLFLFLSCEHFPFTCHSFFFFHSTLCPITLSLSISLSLLLSWSFRITWKFFFESKKYYDPTESFNYQLKCFFLREKYSPGILSSVIFISFDSKKVELRLKTDFWPEIIRVDLS